MNVYTLGKVVRSVVSFTNLAGSPVDPGAITFILKSPLGVETEYVYGTDAEVMKDSTGNYHVDVEPDRQGVWATRWQGTGANKTAEESSFKIAESQFD